MVVCFPSVGNKCVRAQIKTNSNAGVPWEKISNLYRYRGQEDRTRTNFDRPPKQKDKGSGHLVRKHESTKAPTTTQENYYEVEALFCYVGIVVVVGFWSCVVPA